MDAAQAACVFLESSATCEAVHCQRSIKGRLRPQVCVYVCSHAHWSWSFRGRLRPQCSQNHSTNTTSSGLQSAQHCSSIHVPTQTHTLALKNISKDKHYSQVPLSGSHSGTAVCQCPKHFDHHGVCSKRFREKLRCRLWKWRRGSMSEVARWESWQHL